MIDKSHHKIELGSRTIELRDLSDFCVHWDEIKRLVDEPALDGQTLTHAQRATLQWLRVLADRVCRLEDI